MDFVKHLETYLNKEEIDSLLTSLDKPPKGGILINPNKIDKSLLLDKYPSLKENPLIKNSFIYDKESLKPSQNLFYELGCYYLSDPGAMIPASILEVNDKDIILDLCAAPGGKSIQLAFSYPNSLIISNDISSARLNSLEFNSASLGLTNLVITNNDFKKNDLYLSFLNYFDKVVLDAPCSGSGMFRKEEKMKEDWTYNKVLKYQKAQKELILMAFDMLKPGGVLSYSTCSYSEEEDEDIIEYLLNNRSDASLINIPSYSSFYTSRYKPYGIHLFPYLYQGEGQYVCLIKKEGESIYTNIKNKKIDKDTLNYKSRFKENPLPYYLEYKGYLFALPRLIDEKIFNKLNVTYPCVRIGKISNNQVYKYDVHYGRILKDYSFKLELTEKECNEYISGHTLSKDTKDGIYLLTYKGLGLSLCKVNNNIIKNWYNINRYK
ncbi:MAG: RsmB/NOP family class I SAM-dependent RNA methyltransferase [Coprobacillus sp.]|nr:RsmB/NOP family class I SAM-dependent RNA methyltransferase [Coprobacillus sp.]